jgi:tetratricopeptide (TPR) repeat protein
MVTAADGRLEIAVRSRTENGWPIFAEGYRAGTRLPYQYKGLLELAGEPASSSPRLYGTLLGQALFRGKILEGLVRARADQTDGVHVLLNVEAEDLKGWRWECLCGPTDADGWEFLSLDQRVFYSLYLNGSTSRDYRQITYRDLRVLLLVANPADPDNRYGLTPFDAEQNVARLRSSIKRYVPVEVLGRAADASGPPTLDELARHLTEGGANGPHTILHLVCHGQFNRENGDTILYFEQSMPGPVSGQILPHRVWGSELLKQLGQIRELPHLVFLSVCESAAPQAERRIGGLAQRLVRELGIPAVIGMTEAVTVATAHDLADQFYTRLLAGKDHVGQVDRALVGAFAGLASRSDVNVPALYSRLKTEPLFSPILERAETKPGSSNSFQTNVPSRRNLPFVGRDDLLAKIGDVLDDPSLGNVVVIYGESGVGKSELAREYARRQRQRYPGGVFLIDVGTHAVEIDLAKIGRTWLGIDFPEGMSFEDQGIRTLSVLRQSPSLLIFENAYAVTDVEPWLPPEGMPCHVLVTTVLDTWDVGPFLVEVKPLSDAASLQLIEAIAGREIAQRHGEKLVALAAGLPVQLAPQSATLAREARRPGRRRAIQLTLTQESSRSFEGVYKHLNSEAQLLLHAAAQLNHQRILADELKEQVVDACGWNENEFNTRLERCLEVHVLQGADVLTMHRLFSTFVLETKPSQQIIKQLSRIATVQFKRFFEIASTFVNSPNRVDLVPALMTYPLDPSHWQKIRSTHTSRRLIGAGLLQLGQFTAAIQWLQAEVAEVKAGKASSPLDQEELARSLKLLGTAYLEIGKVGDAQLCFKDAAQKWEEAVVHDSQDYPYAAASLHDLGLSLFACAKYSEARQWFERAVDMHERGGRSSPANLGKSLAQVGSCFLKEGDFTSARVWFERAIIVLEESGDHIAISICCQHLGDCFEAAGDLATTRKLFERGVAEAKKGGHDGRIDHTVLSKALNRLGYFFFDRNQFSFARSCFDEAVAAAEKGDIYGRVDHNLLGLSLSRIGKGFSGRRDFVAAQSWFERAIAEIKRGDVTGQVDHSELADTMRLLGWCLRESGDFVTARGWFESAIKEAEKGDENGHVYAKLSLCLNSLGGCLLELKEYSTARPFLERAIAVVENKIPGLGSSNLLGRNMNAMGRSLLGVGEFVAARKWFERAIAEKEKAKDDHLSIGTSMHFLGCCSLCAGDFVDARSRFERAIAEKEKGDKDGRTDHNSIGMSLHHLGSCFLNIGDFVAARSSFECAVSEKERGDLFERLDHESIGSSLSDLGVCLMKVGEFAAALNYFERAIAEKKKGDLYKRIDQKSIDITAKLLAECLAKEKGSAETPS